MDDIGGIARRLFQGRQAICAEQGRPAVLECGGEFFESANEVMRYRERLPALERNSFDVALRRMHESLCAIHS